MNCWLGIDLGHARVGTALSDPGLVLAHPAGNIQAYGNYFHVLDDVVDMIEEHQVSQVVVGLPLQLNGSVGKSAAGAQQWVQALRECIQDRIFEYQQSADELQGKSRDYDNTAEDYVARIAVLQSVRIILRDERLTTVTAHHQMSEAGLAMRKHRRGVDQQAAVIVLQSALDEYQRAYRSTPASTEE